MRILAIVHVFYEEIWPQLEVCLRNASKGGDLSLYVTGREFSQQLKKRIYATFPKATIIAVSNKGYDIYPFFMIINEVDLNSFDVVLKLHTKRDMHSYHVMKNFPAGGSVWREHLLAFIATERNWAATKKLLSRQDVGIVSDSLCIYNKEWDPAPQHYRQVVSIMNKLGLAYKDTQCFVAGSMFAAKASVLKCFKDRFTEKNFDLADAKHTEGLPHVLERVLGYAVCAQGYKIESFNGKNFKFEIYIKKFLNMLFKERITSHRVFYHVFGIPVWYRKHPKKLHRPTRK